MFGVALVAVAALGAWLVLVLLRGGFWLHGPRVESVGEWDPRGGHASVVAVVPARNEADTLPRTLQTLLEQDYPGAFEVVVVDDQSTDVTASVARRLGSAAGQVPLQVVDGTPPPDGWAGKVWALWQGLDHAPGSDLVLFTDADVVLPRDALSRLVAQLADTDRDLASVMVHLRVETRAERLLIPAFVYFFAKLYPFRWVNDGRRATAAAAGGCMLVRRDALQRAGGLAAIRGALIDDVALARQVRRHGRPGGGRLWLGFGDGFASVRPYGRVRDVWRMVARSAFAQLRHSRVLAAATVAGMLVVYLGPPVAAAFGLAGVLGRGTLPAWVALAAGTAGWAAMTASYLPSVKRSGLRAGWALTLPLAALLYAAMTADSARRHRRGGAVWKGRSYAA